MSLSLSPVVLVPLVVSWTLMVRVVVWLVMARVTYGAVVLAVASMVRVLSLAIGGVTYVAGRGGGGEGAVDDEWYG